MNLFNKLVSTVLEYNLELSALKPVVEKEILHHDILRIMHKNGFLDSLTFIGGTCLRMCHGSQRLSEDLDFSGGSQFKKDDLVGLGEVVKADLTHKYGMEVAVSEPQKETGNVSTWKVKVITQGPSKHLPAQRINIDICAIPSHDIKLSLLKNHYGVDLGTRGLILAVETVEEILVDKILAFVLRLNRVKNRDIWDLLWLSEKNVQVNKALVANKLGDRNIGINDFISLFNARVTSIKDHERDFYNEMCRFLTTKEIRLIEQKNFWSLTCTILEDYARTVL